MIESKEDLRFFLNAEWQRNMHTNKYSFTKYLIGLYILRSDGAFAYRLLKALRNYEYAMNCRRNRSLLGKIEYLYRRFYYRKLSIKYNITISANAVDAGLYLPHIVGGGIVIYCKYMGKNCVVNTGTLIGLKNMSDEIPIIGSNCEINAGCKIFGKINIGSNVKMGPNTVVFRDVPENATISGVPAQIIKINNK